MKAIDKLAREICWFGFTDRSPKTVGCTKAQYWKKLPEETRQEYRNRASEFVYLYDNLDHALLGPLSFRLPD